nr:hypothetical protein [Tanacetum cinerariifolium]
MLKNAKIYDETEDSKDHISRFIGMRNQGEWPMPVWCWMFQQALDGKARAWFDKLPLDPTEISKIVRKANESLLNFIERWVSESSVIPNVPELMQILSFKSSYKCLELSKHFSDSISKTVDEMLKRVHDYVRSEEAFRDIELPRGEPEHRPLFRPQEHHAPYIAPYRPHQDFCRIEYNRDNRVVLTLDSLSMEDEEVPLVDCVFEGALGALGMRVDVWSMEDEEVPLVDGVFEGALGALGMRVDVWRIEEEQAAKARYWKILACCDDDDDYDSAITPILSTKEPINSLSMGDEHFDTIPATESDEVIKSSVEDLIPIPIEFGEISSGSTTTQSDISLYEYDSFIFDPTHEEFAYELAHIISPPEYDCFYFRDLPDPGELMSMLNSGIRENLLSTTSVNLPIEDDYSPLLAYVVWIFVAYLTYPVIPPYLHPFGNEDTIFDPGITINHFYSFKPGSSHRHGAFKKFNTHRSHLNEWPMIINGKNTPLLDVLMFQFYPP